MAFELEFNPKQQAFLATTADVCLMGGGLGSGKTLAAVMLLLRMNCPASEGGPGWKNPKYNAIICRKHFKDLRDIISKTKQLYPLIDPGAFFHQGNLIWTFTSGATIQIAYIETIDACISMCQGAEYQTVVIDEAMHFSDDKIFLYLMSRLRNTCGMRNYMRLTSNPGRYLWLREYFRIDAVGNSTDFTLDYTLEDGTIVTKRVRYIQAKLSDNPFLPKEYQATIAMMAEEDKLALLHGRWDSYESVAGQVFEHELKALTAQHRLTTVVHDPSLPVYTFWDLGISDNCVILFVQFVGKEVRIIDMISDNNKSLQAHYIPDINKRKEDKGYQYGGHYLPHDSAARDKFSGLGILEQAQKYLNDVEALPLVALSAGLTAAKTMFANVWIERSLPLYNDLTKYRREYDDKLLIYTDKPVHDKYSHTGDAFRYISYYKPKQKLDTATLNPFRTQSNNPFARG